MFVPSINFVRQPSGVVFPSISGLRGHWVADVGVALSGADVTQWNDQSGNGYHLTPVGTNPPTFGATAFNSLPGLIFTNATPRTLGQASGNLGFTGSDTLCSIFMVLHVPSGQVGRAVSLCGAGAGDYGNLFGALPIFFSGSDDKYTTFKDGVAFTTNLSVPGNYRLGYWQNGTSMVQYVNGTGGGTNSTPSSTNFSSGTRVAIGANAGSFIETGLLATVAELVIANSAMSGTEISDLDAYFVSKWGL